MRFAIRQIKGMRFKEKEKAEFRMKLVSDFKVNNVQEFEEKNSKINERFIPIAK